LHNQVAAVDRKPWSRERFDREYLLAVVDKDLFWLERRSPFSNPAWYLDKIDPDMYVNRNYAPLNVRMKAYIKYARGSLSWPTTSEPTCNRPAKTYVELGIARFGDWLIFIRRT